MEQMQTAQRLAGGSFGVNGVPFWGKLKARKGKIALTGAGMIRKSMTPPA